MATDWSLLDKDVIKGGTSVQGTTHAVSGFAGGLWVATWSRMAVGPWNELVSGTSLPGLHVLSDRDALLFAAVAAGWAIASDLDTPRSKATRVWGRLSATLTWPLRKVVKHRKQTHYLVLSSLAMAGLVLLAGMYPLAAALVVAWVTGLALTGLDDVLPGDTSHPGTNLTLSAIAGALAYHFSWYPWWMPLAAAVGVAVHIIGDSLTTAKAPRIGGGRWGLGLFSNGTRGESIVFVLLCGAIGYWFVYSIGAAASPLRQLFIS
ncbi:Uncharacterised protein [Dermatophilus congolensis]|uniref:Inner membrane protein n=1 Tax=Dermatophilus congolensis TaxID=1863 RepID=A0AA46BN02_9MICO|nr:metal-dependent hydrolase [Dermatophilus congolensis]STD08323.1 Uncharacterised protein [Dermatophilus congolensis]